MSENSNKAKNPPATGAKGPRRGRAGMALFGFSVFAASGLACWGRQDALALLLLGLSSLGPVTCIVANARIEAKRLEVLGPRPEDKEAEGGDPLK